jgi:hypothetical protein
MSSHVAAPEEAPWHIGLRGARANLVPGLILQAVALAIALAYYFYTPVREALENVSAFKEHYGFGYSIVATGIFGGVLPALYLRLQPATRHRYTLAQAGALTLFWAYKGLEVDLWYRVLAHVVGSDNSAATVVQKMLLDQFVYCPAFAVPLTVLFYAWVETGFDAGAVWKDLRQPRWYARRAVPNLISNMGVWIPTVCIVYALPTSLQIPLFNLVLCFFTLLLAHISAHSAPET